MTSAKFTFNRIQEYWQTHTESDAIAEIPKDNLQLLENVEFSDSPYESHFFDSVRSRYQSVDCQHCVVSIEDNTLRFYSRCVMSPLMMEEDTIGRIGVTDSQLKLIEDEPIDKKVENVVRYVHGQQIRFVSRIKKMTETITDVNEMTKDEANELWVYNRLGFITDDEVENIWKTDGNKILGIALS